MSEPLYIFSKVHAITYRELVQVLQDHPEFLDNNIQFHDFKEGVWSRVDGIRLDSTDSKLVLEGSEDILPKDG